MIVLSQLQIKPLLDSYRAGETHATTTLDLNRTTSEVELGEQGVHLPEGQLLSWEQAEEIIAHKHACYVVEQGEIERVHFFSRRFQRVYTLCPTERAPTMLLASFPMHRIKGIDPHEDTLRKIRAISPLQGYVLDTTMGLGYTAIEAARSASRVLTLELDPTVLEVARRNPWSQELFTNPRIERRIGSAVEIVPTLPNQTFHAILHDPPTLRLAGELYSTEFYRELLRVLKKGGRLFHYIGDLESASGQSVVKGVVKRLQDVGFKRVVRVQEAFGVVAST